MVEFAFVGVLVILLLLGVVAMGLLLSFKQSITQATAEGARSVVGILDDPATEDDPLTPEYENDERDDLVLSTLDSVVSSHTDAGCETSGMDCEWKIHSCAEDTNDFNTLPDDRPGSDECITVKVTFDNTGEHRPLPYIPLISTMEPDTISSQSTARLQT